MRVVVASALLSLCACGGSPSNTNPSPDASDDATGDSGTSPDTSPGDATPPPDMLSGDTPPGTDARAMPDGTTPTDAADDYLPPPATCSRPLLPISTTRTSTQRPTLQFARGPGLRETLVELCRQRDCADTVLSTRTTDDYLALSMPLAAGVYFWRITPRDAMGATCTSATWQFTAPPRSAMLPRTWGTTLDVNGDGYADLAVATVGATGEVRVYHGGAMGLSETPAVVIDGLPATTALPPVPVSAGDLDGDGFGELAIGLPAADMTTGEVRIYRGRATGLRNAADATLRSPDGRFGRFGVALAGVGDIEGDGYADLVVGAPHAGATSATETPGTPGKVYAFHGSERGVRTTPTATVTGPGGANGLFGSALAAAGDVNSDRFPDMAVGARGEGTVYIIRGSALGLNLTTLIPLRDAATMGFGARVVGAGDVDGDNRSDVIVAGSDGVGRVVVRAAGSDGMFSTAGVTLTMGGGFGRALAAGDFNGDGFADVAVGAPDMAAVFVYPGAMGALTATPVVLRGAMGFGTILASAGDANRDAVTELAVAGASGSVAVFAGTTMGAPTLARTLPVTAAVGALGGASCGL